MPLDHHTYFLVILSQYYISSILVLDKIAASQMIFYVPPESACRLQKSFLEHCWQPGIGFIVAAHYFLQLRRLGVELIYGRLVKFLPVNAISMAVL